MTRQGDESGDLKPQKTRTGLVILLLANHVQRSAQLGDVYDTPGHQKFRKNNEKTRRYESSASQGIHEGEPRGVSITWPQPATRAIIRPVGSTGQIQVESWSMTTTRLLYWMPMVLTNQKDQNISKFARSCYTYTLTWISCTTPDFDKRRRRGIWGFGTCRSQ